MATQHLRFVVLVIALFVSAPASLQADPAKSSEPPATGPSASDESTVKKITLAEFDAMRAEKDTVVLDVRTPKEFAAGHVPGAVNMDWHLRDFNERAAKLNKSKKYLAHLYDFSGGWSAWQKAGKAVEK